MNPRKPAWLMTLLGVSLFQILLVPMHVSDEIARGEAFTEYGSTSFLLIGAAIFLIGLGMSYRQSRAGYIIILALSVGNLYANFFGHTIIIPTSYIEIARTSGPFFVWVILMIGMVSLSSILLSIYGLLRGRR